MIGGIAKLKNSPYKSKPPNTQVISEFNNHCKLEALPDAYLSTGYGSSAGGASCVTPLGIVTCYHDSPRKGKRCKRFSKSGKWEDFPSFNYDRRNYGMKSINGKIWAIGGQKIRQQHCNCAKGDYANAYLNMMEYMDLNVQPLRWERKYMPFGIHSHCVAELPNNRLLVTFGNYPPGGRSWTEEKYEVGYQDLQAIPHWKPEMLKFCSQHEVHVVTCRHWWNKVSLYSSSIRS